MARSPDDVAHAFHYLPTIHADVPYTAWMPQIADRASEKQVTSDGLDRDNQTFSFSVSGGSAEPLAQRQADCDCVRGREGREAEGRFGVESLLREVRGSR